MRLYFTFATLLLTLMGCATPHEPQATASDSPRIVISLKSIYVTNDNQFAIFAIENKSDKTMWFISYSCVQPIIIEQTTNYSQGGWTGPVEVGELECGTGLEYCRVLPGKPKLFSYRFGSLAAKKPFHIGIDFWDGEPGPSFMYWSETVYPSESSRHANGN